MDVFEAIYTRRSMRYFKDGEKVPDWKLERIFDVARWAPSGENMQYWKYIIIRDQEVKRWLADISEETAIMVAGRDPWEVTMDRQWFMAEDFRPYAFQGFTHLLRYPEKSDVVLIPCITPADTDYPTGMGEASYHPYVGIGAGIQNVWLAATALGVGCGFNAVAVADTRRSEELFDYLGVPRSVKPITALCLGVPAILRAAAPSRYPLESIMYDEVWGNPYRRVDYREKKAEKMVSTVSST
ncbi:MAG: nitroreductase family protein [Candidatus Lokiarchaeia archaeon]